MLGRGVVAKVVVGEQEIVGWPSWAIAHSVSPLAQNSHSWAFDRKPSRPAVRAVIEFPAPPLSHKHHLHGISTQRP